MTSTNANHEVFLYEVHCDFDDGSRSSYDGLMMGDLMALVGTFDNLPSMIECSISRAHTREDAT